MRHHFIMIVALVSLLTACTARVAKLPATPTLPPTYTPYPTYTEQAPLPIYIVAPSVTPSPLPSATAVPSNTPSPQPSATPSPTVTSKPTATARPSPTATPTTPLLVYLSDVEALARFVKPTPTRTASPTAVPEVLLGKIIFRSSLYAPNPNRNSGRTYVVDPDGANMALLIDTWSYSASLDREWVSPDGADRICQWSQGEGALNLYLCSATGERRRQLTSIGHGKAYDAAWSPDGRHICYASNEGGDDDLFVLDLDTGRVVNLTPSDDWQSDKHPSYSPDGRQIVYYSNRSGVEQIWIMNADGSDPRPLVTVDAGCWDPVWIKYR